MGRIGGKKSPFTAEKTQQAAQGPHWCPVKKPPIRSPIEIVPHWTAAVHSELTSYTETQGR